MTQYKRLNIYDDNDNSINNFKDYFFKMSGVLLSSIITFSASI